MSGRDRGWVAEPVGSARREKCENGGSSGDVDENKGGQVSGARCQGGTGDGLQSPLDPHAGKSAKMKVHPGMLMKTKDGRGRGEIGDEQV